MIKLGGTPSDARRDAGYDSEGLDTMSNRNDRRVEAILENTRATRDAAYETRRAADEQMMHAQMLAEEQAERQASEQRRLDAQHASARAQRQRSDQLRHRFLLFRQELIAADPALRTDPDSVELRWREHVAEQAGRVGQAYTAARAELDGAHRQRRAVLDLELASMERARPRTASSLYLYVLLALVPTFAYAAVQSGPRGLISLVVLITLAWWHVGHYRAAVAAEPAMTGQSTTGWPVILVAAKALPLATVLAVVLLSSTGAEPKGFLLAVVVTGLASYHALRQPRSLHGLETEYRDLVARSKACDEEHHSRSAVTLEDFQDHLLLTHRPGTPSWA